jgi:uncharacterized membrane protein YfcA
MRLPAGLHKQTSRVVKLLAVVGMVAASSAMAQAAALPAILGDQESFAPVHLSGGLFAMAIGLGFCSGLITGTIGIGGGFILTPALMSLGVRGILAVGTGMFYIFVAAIMGSAMHRKLGNISLPLVAVFGTASLVGVNFGAGLNKRLYAGNPLLSDLVITALYIVLLGFLAVYSLCLFWRLLRLETAGAALDPRPLTWLARKVQSWRAPPLLRLEPGKSLSAWVVAWCGLLVGLVASIMGVGGGFLTFPLYVYVLGVSPATAAGTCLVQIIVTAGYAAIVEYAAYGFVVYGLAVGLLIGALLGVQLGCMTTGAVRAHHLQGFYATTILAGFVNRLFALPEKLTHLGYVEAPGRLARALAAVGTGAFFILIVFFAVWVVALFFCNLPRLRQGNGHAATAKRH